MKTKSSSDRRKTNTGPVVNVPETLAAPHRFIAAWIEEDRQAGEQAKRNGWPYKSTCTSKLDQRRLRLMSALCDALEECGHRLEWLEGSGHAVVCVIAGEPIEFWVREYVRAERSPLSAAELKRPLNIAENRTWKIAQKPTGLLVLLAKAGFRHKPQRWSDSSGPLENQLGSAIVKFKEMAAVAATKRIELAEFNRKIEAEVAAQTEREAQRVKDAQDWERVRELAADWSEAERLRQFIGVVAARLEIIPDPDGHGRSWLAWAGAKAEEFDPMGCGSELTLTQLVNGEGLRRWRVRDDEDDELWGY